MSKIIVALDHMSYDNAFSLAEKLKEKVWGFKLRLPMMAPWGVTWAKQFGKVMVDPKCFDIESSMVDDVKTMVDLGVDLITLHASSGQRRMRACMEATKHSKTKLLAVTVLTDTVDEELEMFNMMPEPRFETDRNSVIRYLWDLACRAGMHGVVCGLPDLPLLNPAPSLSVCPGFRPPGTDANEQKVTGGYDAAEKASLIVIGRPITQAKDPLKVVEEINKGLN
jgi:orotidine-5'-phosphate decarboxylase